MKKLLLSLMVLALFSSCGKDNKVNTGSAPVPPAVQPIQPPSAIIADSNASQLLNYINTSELTFARAPTNSTQFKYTTYSSVYNCEEKEGWFNIEYTKCKTENSLVSESILINSLDLEVKRQELRDIVASSSESIQVFGTAYRIKASNGTIYVINRSTPLLSNPFSVQTINGTLTRYLGTK